MTKPASAVPVPGSPRSGTPEPGTLVPGTAVRVRDEWPEAHGPVHIRTPHYLRGKPGVVAAYLGSFPNPEDLAFARPARVLPLYHVAFRPRDLWPDANADEVVVELFGPWLERVQPSA